MAIKKTAFFVCSLTIVSLVLKQTTLPTYLGGNVDKDFKKVKDIFDEAVKDGRLLGGAVAAYYKGKKVVDLWGGYADVESNRKWTKDTIAIFYSTTKLFGALMIARMVDKGQLDYNRPVADYWPEFGQNGKSKITVEMLVSHQAGLAVWNETFSLIDLKENPQHIVQMAARQTPQYEPGSKFGYHALTFGLYVDTLLQKVDPAHRNVSTIFLEDIAVPFDVDFHIGLPKADFHRKARTYLSTLREVLWQVLTSGDIMAELTSVYKALPFSGSRWVQSSQMIRDLGENQRFPNNPDLITAGLTSMNGYGSARSVAKILSVLATGGTYKGKQLLSAKGIANLGERIVEGIDDTFGKQTTFGRGTFISRNPQGQVIFGHPGFGAQIGFVDPHSGLSFAFCTNYLTIFHFWNHPLVIELQNAVYDVIKNK